MFANDGPVAQAPFVWKANLPHEAFFKSFNTGVRGLIPGLILPHLEDWELFFNAQCDEWGLPFLTGGNADNSWLCLSCRKRCLHHSSFITVLFSVTLFWPWEISEVTYIDCFGDEDSDY